MIIKTEDVTSAYEDVNTGDIIKSKQGSYTIIHKKRTMGLRVDSKGRSISTCPWCNSNTTLHSEGLKYANEGYCLQQRLTEENQVLLKKDVCMECGREFYIELWITKTLRRNKNDKTRNRKT